MTLETLELLEMIERRFRIEQERSECGLNIKCKKVFRNFLHRLSKATPEILVILKYWPPYRHIQQWTRWPINQAEKMHSTQYFPQAIRCEHNDENNMELSEDN